MRFLLAAPILIASLGSPLPAQDVQVPAFTLPPSNQLSAEAKQILMRMKEESAPKDIGSDLAKHRAFYQDRKSTRLNSSHVVSSYAVFCLKKHTQATASIPVHATDTS